MGLTLLARVVRDAGRDRPAARAHAGRALCHPGTDDPALGRRDRGPAVDEDLARRHRDGPGPARHRQPAGRPRAALRGQLGGQPARQPGRRVRRDGALRGTARERRCAGRRAARTRVVRAARQHREERRRRRAGRAARRRARAGRRRPGRHRQQPDPHARGARHQHREHPHRDRRRQDRGQADVQGRRAPAGAGRAVDRRTCSASSACSPTR